MWEPCARTRKRLLEAKSTPRWTSARQRGPKSYKRKELHCSNNLSEPGGRVFREHPVGAQQASDLISACEAGAEREAEPSQVSDLHCGPRELCCFGQFHLRWLVTAASRNQQDSLDKGPLVSPRRLLWTFPYTWNPPLTSWFFLLSCCALLTPILPDTFDEIFSTHYSINSHRVTEVEVKHYFKLWRILLKYK